MAAVRVQLNKTNLHRVVIFPTVSRKLKLSRIHCIIDMNRDIKIEIIFLQKVSVSILMIALMTRVVFSQLSEDEMKTILEKFDRDALLLCNKNVKANWAVATDVLNAALVEAQVSWGK